MSKDAKTRDELTHISLGFPMVVMVEYSSIMANILAYVSSKTGGSNSGNEKREKLQRGLIQELNGKLNTMWSSLMWVALIHCAMLTFDAGNMLFWNFVIFTAMIGHKLFIYCRFMDSQHT